MVGTLLRALTYATLFIGAMLVFLPARVLEWSGVGRPTAVGAAQVVGVAVVLMGLALALWCVLTFALRGRGTPAPFDPPRRLVILGPYAFVRNPMYIGAVVALLGAALFYRSLALLAYACAFLLAAHVLVVLYEEPTLWRTFASDYEAYLREVHRWLPRTRPFDWR
jgi:protein-S-isoprenylcysteine O-methyltransferase Ste14